MLILEPMKIVGRRTGVNSLAFRKQKKTFSFHWSAVTQEITVTETTHAEEVQDPVEDLQTPNTTPPMKVSVEYGTPYVQMGQVIMWLYYEWEDGSTMSYRAVIYNGWLYVDVEGQGWKMTPNDGDLTQVWSPTSAPPSNYAPTPGQPWGGGGSGGGGGGGGGYQQN